MNVHITCTPDFPEDDLTKIVYFLKSIPGELNFKQEEILNREQFSVFDKRFENNGEIVNFTFEEYFHLVESYRRLTKIPKDEFVILISKIKPFKNWFSAFDGKNIFVEATYWEKFSDADPKYGISYQCVENIFQSLLNLDINNPLKDPYIHNDTKGCINDFCGVKSKILHKFRTADICSSCYARAIEIGINENVLTHILNIIEDIRKAFVISGRHKKIIKPEPIKIDEKGNIQIGNKEIVVDTLPKVIFIFFLKNLQGIDTKRLSDHEEEFYRIYKTLRRSAERERIRKMCYVSNNIGDNKEDKTTFQTYRTKLKKALIKHLGDPLYKFYFVDCEEGIGCNNYKINITHDYLSIDPRF